jgi:phospholipid/cholesterol/gamma-HCH transport system ATP-binding protein
MKNQSDKETVIEISGLKKSFDQKQVLKDINLSLYKGENLVVLGKSGTGKSVLIKCIVGLIKPESGSMKVLGKDVMKIGEEELDELRKKIGFLFQSAALYDSMTVSENLEFTLRRHFKEKSKKERRELVDEALDNVGLKDAREKMPSELSGGMKKRVGLARTLILKPEIILYDEPTTGLDPVTSKEMSNLLIETQKKYNTSSIIITHDMACAKIVSNRIVVLQDGVYIAEGTYNELEKSEDEGVSSFFIKPVTGNEGKG